MSPTKEKLRDVKFEEAMEIAGYGKFSMYIIFLSGLTISISLLGSVDISYLLPAAECDFQLSSADKGLLSSAYFIGTIAASHLSGFLADTLGRRYILVRGLSLNVLVYILTSLAPNFWTFFVLKFLTGVLTCPTMIATFPFLGEFIPTKRRSQALLITTSISNLSLLYSTLIGWLTLRGTWKIDLWFITFAPWRLFYLLCGMPSLIASILFYLTPESPKFLLTRGKKGDTLKVLQRVHSINSGKLPDSYPIKSVSMDADEFAPPLVQGKGAGALLKHVCNQTLPLFKPPFFKNLVYCLIMLYSLCLCVNSIFLWLPEIINRMVQFKEENQGRFYICEMMSRDSGNVTAEPGTTGECKATINTAVFVPNFLISLVQPIVMLIASFIVPLFDRRLVLGFLVVCCSGMAFLITWVPVASVIVILLGGIPIIAGICYNVLTGIVIELFPTYIRAMAVSLNMISGRMGSITGSQLFSQMIDSHCSLLFKIISGLLLCCAVVPFFFKLKKVPPEEPSERETHT
uniref:Major facilitator superfamily (MFS) profile domain-containing protein n=1 Tax=Graphocephala atropunctata TaxID=36148 RepID=A0A1B6KVL9_9HEMI